MVASEAWPQLKSILEFEIQDAMEALLEYRGSNPDTLRALQLNAAALRNAKKRIEGAIYSAIAEADATVKTLNLKDNGVKQEFYE